jgi:hypothetical protein
MAEESNPFQDLLNAETEKITATKKPAKKGATTAPSLLIDTAKEYPRATLTAGVVGAGAVKATQNWQKLYKEGLVTLRNRADAEAKMVTELGNKGVEAIPRLKLSNDALKSAAKRYAMEKVFTGFPFNNAEAAARVADTATGRVIITGEKRPVWTGTKIRGLEVDRPFYTVGQRPSPFNVAVEPKQVTLDTAKGIPRLKTTPTNVPFDEKALRSTMDALEEGRTGKLPAYVPRSAPNPRLPTRIAEVSTGGKFGKGTAILEGAGAVYDIFREGGQISNLMYDRSKPQNKEVSGLMGVEAGLRSLGRLGRGAANSLTFGAPEYLGVYDIPDLLEVESEAQKRYMNLRGSAGYPAESFPIIKKGGRYVPMDGDNPQLKAMEARVAAERGIESSLMTEGYYKGPEYTYIVQNGKVVPMLRPEYSAMYDARSIAAMDAANNRRPVLNVDPSMGGMGWQRLPQQALTLQDYADYMAQPR